MARVGLRLLLQQSANYLSYLLRGQILQIVQDRVQTFFDNAHGLSYVSYSLALCGLVGRYQRWYHGDMAMTLRLDDDETEALRARAQLEGRSMQEVARQAVRDYVERTSRRDLLDKVLDEELPRYSEALRRLGE